MGVAQRLVPVAASTAAQYSRRLPLPSFLEISANARPWLTAKELNPFVSDIFVQTTKPALLVAHVVAIASGEEPSVAGPRYCGQSVARATACPSNSRINTAPARARLASEVNDCVILTPEHIMARLLKQKLCCSDNFSRLILRCTVPPARLAHASPRKLTAAARRLPMLRP